MATVEEKLKSVESRFRHGSKRYHAARYIVKLDHQILEDEKKAICKGIPIADKTLQALIRELKKMGLYPPQETSDISDRPLITEIPKEPSHHVPEAPQPPLQMYVTKKDFETQFETLRNSTNETLETLRDSINNLASLLNEEPPSNPGEDEEEEEEEDEMSLPVELIQPGELIIQDGSSTREAVYIKPKTRMYFDMSKQGAFNNYPGTREPGPFANFNGNISDFFNIIVDEFFIRNYNADIGLTMRMPVK